MKGDHDVLVPWSKILYYLRLAWPRKIKNKCHTGRPLCLGNAIQGDHCVPGRPRETTGDQSAKSAKSIGKTGVLAVLKQKFDSHSGRTVKKNQNH